VNTKRAGMKIMPGYTAAQNDFHAKCRWHDFWQVFWHELVNRAPGDIWCIF
jgi:hypothetical protein